MIFTCELKMKLTRNLNQSSITVIPNPGAAAHKGAVSSQRLNHGGPLKININRLAAHQKSFLKFFGHCNVFYVAKIYKFSHFLLLI